MSLNQRVTAEFSTCTPSAPPTADLSIQTNRSLGLPRRNAPIGISRPLAAFLLRILPVGLNDDRFWRIAELATVIN
jgi:hypothetical protein